MIFVFVPCFRRPKILLRNLSPKCHSGFRDFQVGPLYVSVLQQIPTNFMYELSDVNFIFYQRACLHLVMRGWISHPKDGLLVVLTILKCIWALRICMLLVLPKNFYLSFWKEKNTSIWWTIFWKQCSPWYSAWYFRLVTVLSRI